MVAAFLRGLADSVDLSRVFLDGAYADSRDYLFNLHPLLLDVGDVEFAPLALADTYVLGVIEHGIAVDPQLLKGLVEQVGSIRICFCSAAFSIGSGRSRAKIASSTATAG
jgi:hypothetical protein